MALRRVWQDGQWRDLGGPAIGPISDNWNGPENVRVGDGLIWDGTEWVYYPVTPVFIGGDSGETQLNSEKTFTIPVPGLQTSTSDRILILLRSEIAVTPDWSGTGVAQLEGILSTDNGVNGAAILWVEGFEAGQSVSLTADNLSQGDYIGWTIAAFANVSTLDLGLPFSGSPNSAPIEIPGVSAGVTGIPLLLATQTFGGNSGLTGTFGIFLQVDPVWGDGGAWMYFDDDLNDSLDPITVTTPQSTQPTVAWQGILY